MLTFAPCSGKALSSIPSRILLPTPCLSSSSLTLPSCPVVVVVSGGCLLCMMFPSAECVNASCSIGSSGSTSPSGACLRVATEKSAGCLNARDIPRRYPYGLSHWSVYCRLSTLHNSPACTGIRSRISTTGVCCGNGQTQRHTLRRLVMDEFALCKPSLCHRGDGCGRPLWVGEGPAERPSALPSGWG